MLPFLAAIPGKGQQVMLQGFHYDIPKAQCGAAWADTLSAKAAQLAAAGFTHLWAPPFHGNGPNSGGYDPKNLYIGDDATLTSLGTKRQVLDMVSAFNRNGIDVVGDLIYNHRDGGAPEINNPVLDYIMNRAGNNIAAGYQYSMPSDRYHYVIPLGAAAGNGQGKYYVKFSSRTSTYTTHKYMLYVTTKKIGGSRWEPKKGPNTVLAERPGNYVVELGRNYEVRIDNDGDVDEFEIAVNSSDFGTDDELMIYAININPDDIASYSNHRPYEIWYDPMGSAGNGAARNLADCYNMWGPGGLHANYKLRVKTYTDFSGMPGAPAGSEMNGSNFRPNWSGSSEADAKYTLLGPPWSRQSMDFAYDYDHQNADTRKKLIDWTVWNWDKVGIRGLRIDAIKHFPASFVGELLCALHSAGKDPSLVVGEWYGLDPRDQSAWLTEVYSKLTACSGGSLNPKIFDFNLRDLLKKATDGGNGASTSMDCSDSKSWDVREIFSGSLHDGHSFNGVNIVTMANNHDFRSSNPEFGVSLLHHRGNALNSYAYLLTNNHLGVPAVFWPDYYGYDFAIPTWDGTTCVARKNDYFPAWKEGGLKREIDELIGVLRTYIVGSVGVDYLNKSGGPAITYYSGCYKRSLIYQNSAIGSKGGKELLNVINYGNDPVDVEIPLIVRNGIAAGGTFTKVAGTTSTPSPRVTAGGKIRVTVPAHSFATWVQGAAPAAISKVELTARASESGVRLEGSFVNEKPVKAYQLQRSLDAIHFSDISTTSVRTNQENTTFAFTDIDAPVGKRLFYRVQVSLADGAVEYSASRETAIAAGKLQLEVSPNPANTLATIKIFNPLSQQLDIAVSDIKGRMVQQQQLYMVEGAGKIDLDVSKLQAGIYFVTVTDGSSREVVRLAVR